MYLPQHSFEEGALVNEFDSGGGRTRAAVIGLDGATMRLLSPLVARGLLPNLGRLLADGVYAPLVSTIPPFTGPAWTSIVTGVNPGRHGVYGFGVMDAETGQLSLVQTGHIGSPRLWQLANARDLSVGVINVPVIYPPDAVEGFMLTGMLTPSGTDRFIHPPSLAGLVHEAAGGQYRVDIDVRPERLAHSTGLVAELAGLLTQRERVIHALLDHATPDFLMVVLVIPDRLQHVYWGYMVPDGVDDPVYRGPQAPAFRAEIEALYVEVDAVVGRLLDRVGPDCRTFVVSDHGFGRYKRVVKLNNWLRDQGWLTLHPGGGVMQALKRALLGMPGLRQLIGTLQRGRVGCSARGAMIDWTHTRAYTGTVFQQGVYINLEGRQLQGCVKSADYAPLREEIVAGLAAVRDPQTDEPLFEHVYVREQVFHGPCVDQAPDILPVVKGNDGLLEPGFGSGGVVQYQNHLPYGCHHPDGVFMAHGPGVRRGVRLPAASVVDITPTVLYALGVPVPNDLDGKVLEGIFEPGCLSTDPPRMDGRPAKQVVASLQGGTQPESEAEDYDAVVERLRALGYL